MRGVLSINVFFVCGSVVNQNNFAVVPLELLMEHLSSIRHVQLMFLSAFIKTDVRKNWLETCVEFLSRGCTFLIFILCNTILRIVVYIIQHIVYRWYLFFDNLLKNYFTFSYRLCTYTGRIATVNKLMLRVWLKWSCRSHLNPTKCGSNQHLMGSKSIF